MKNNFPPVEPYSSVRHDSRKEKVVIIIEVSSEGKMLDPKKMLQCESVISKFADEINTALFY
ncbi:hypothetical protein [Methanococcus maripaludis]|uniref:hypothetical protein n=1 Tax=Methanococcus maripaludis TaxID=39152 RepID=UPI000CF1E5C7|nr:hypothetical protein [Methanococcus maripaludis]